MAKIVRINTWNEINISSTVGRNGVNNKNDVMVIQALLKYALSENQTFKDERFPEPTGTIDQNTVKLIKKYQRFVCRKQKVNVSIDGRIDPSRGTTFVPGKNILWTICSLNADANAMHFLSNRPGANYMYGLCNRFPQIKPILGEIPVGELGLTLEPSRNVVGTLGLSLE